MNYRRGEVTLAEGQTALTFQSIRQSEEDECVRVYNNHKIPKAELYQLPATLMRRD
jgi:hypothetical protein